MTARAGTSGTGGARIPVVLCIDVEPDGFFLDRQRRDPWTGFERAVPLFQRLRSTLGGRPDSPPRVTWTVRMDPQVADVYGRADWAPVTYAREFDALLALGDEIGVHPHAYRWNDASGTWTLDYGDTEWVERCVRMSCDSFAAAFGRPCQTFRFGDRWISHEAVQLLEALGIRYELTLEPGLPGGGFGRHGDRVTGSLPDLTHVPTRPYHPSTDDFRRPGTRSSGLCLVPLSTARVRPVWWRRTASRLLGRGIPPMSSTLLLSHAPQLFRRIVQDVLARPGTPYLAMALRCNAAASPRLVRRITANLETLRRHPLASQFTWVTPAELPEMLTASSAGRSAVR